MEQGEIEMKIFAWIIVCLMVNIILRYFSEIRVFDIPLWAAYQGITAWCTTELIMWVAKDE